jgi:hypothetical protein
VIPWEVTTAAVKDGLPLLTYVKKIRSTAKLFKGCNKNIDFHAKNTTKKFCKITQNLILMTSSGVR